MYSRNTPLHLTSLSVIMRGLFLHHSFIPFYHPETFLLPLMNLRGKSFDTQNPSDLTAATRIGKITSKATQKIFVHLHVMHANADWNKNIKNLSCSFYTRRSLFSEIWQTDIAERKKMG